MCVLSLVEWPVYLETTHSRMALEWLEIIGTRQVGLGNKFVVMENFTHHAQAGALG